MSGFLLDTDTISLFYRRSASTGFAEWMSRQEERNAVYLSAITIHEIEKGIRLLDHRGAVAKALAIRAWLLGLIAGYGANILPMDAAVARLSGELETAAIAAGHAPGAADAMIAGTAKHHGLTVITRNDRHFQHFGISVLPPDRIGT